MELEIGNYLALIRIRFVSETAFERDNDKINAIFFDMSDFKSRHSACSFEQRRLDHGIGVCDENRASDSMLATAPTTRE